MNVSRARRRLTATRRAASVSQPWRLAPNHADSSSAYRLVQLLARRRYFNSLRIGYQHVDQMYQVTDDCGGWTWDPPCGDCHWCASMMVFHWADKQWGQMLDARNRRRGKCRNT